ncbi:Adaptin ear-binding coat-associated protein 2 [Saguinus oedipus]|uniref:Adaptin ear-binding coat-associated protein 2 n=1 Tax=Saguinus oedipus TaxID=9490 RepID=A0ABQ9UFH8_SAGOE|nr:Adaptin ear-binding coat-associated protein 2 [Saguinus oedipus]
MEENGYKSALYVKPDVHVYRIPLRATNHGYRAAEWQLDQPSWSGRLRITAKGQMAYIKLEDRTSGELFAQAPVHQFPGTAVESDHFKWVKQQYEFAKQAQNPDQSPRLDLGFKEGRTIKLDIANMKKKEGAAGNPRAQPASTGGLSLLPLPQGAKPPPSSLPLGSSCWLGDPSSSQQLLPLQEVLLYPGHSPSLPPLPPLTSGETLPNLQDQLPARPNQAGFSSDLSTIFPHVTSEKELPHLSQRKEGEAFLSWPVFGA